MRLPGLILLAFLLAATSPFRAAAEDAPAIPAGAAAQFPDAAATAEAVQPGAAAPVAAPAAGDDDGGWNFDDEEEEERALTTAEIVKPQIVDIVAFTGLMVLCMVSFFKKSEKLKVATLVYTLVFLGFLRSQLYSVVNIFGLMTLSLPIFSHSIFTYMFWGVTLGTTVVWGRIYCGRLCAYGALTQLMDTFVPQKWQLKIPVKVEQNAYYFKYALLAFVIVYYFATKDILISRWVEPFWMFGALANFSAFTAVPGAWLLWGMLVVLLLASIVVKNLYCRFICPVGTFLGIISSVTTIFRIKRWSECKTCKICEKACEWGAIQGPRIVRSECVRCDDCERIYDDELKCVHHIVIRRKEEVLARQAAQAKAHPLPS
ncbi:MAG: 4Fe-4S binding protein [Vicinamibacterales bacterium]